MCLRASGIFTPHPVDVNTIHVGIIRIISSNVRNHIFSKVSFHFIVWGQFTYIHWLLGLSPWKEWMYLLTHGLAQTAVYLTRSVSKNMDGYITYHIKLSIKWLNLYPSTFWNGTLPRFIRWLQHNCTLYNIEHIIACCRIDIFKAVTEVCYG